MGMTIDESIDWIKNTILDMRRSQICISDRLALEKSIDTMQKYQKIEQIYKEWFSNKGHTSAEAYEKIGEVLKNWND